ncbi:MAG TPA: hypothetical protein VL404_01000 [Candidatus Eisenbacteria bacterium]|nr:hypothetical protein [Candidatus Eisenbacteria bacterium]
MVLHGFARPVAAALVLSLSFPFPAGASAVNPSQDRFRREAAYFEVQNLARRQSGAQSLVDAKNATLQLSVSSATAPAGGLVDSYDESGRLVYREEYSGGYLTHTYDFAYDAAGRLDTQIVTDYAPGPVLTRQSVFFYDDAERLVSKMDYDYRFRLIGELDYTYDSRGRVETKTVREFDGQGRSRRDTVTSYEAGKPVYVLKKEYAAGVLSVSTLSEAGKLVWKAGYDASANPLTKEWYVTDAVSGTQVLARRAEMAPSGSAAKITSFDRSGAATAVYLPPALDDGPPIASWFSRNQAANGTGLIVSHPDEPGFIYHEGIQQEWAKIYANTQAYTYDQALAGIAMADAGNLTGAGRIFDYFYGQWQAEGAAFTGFWTAYNVDPAFPWKRYEWRKGMGENAWMALFCLRYAEKAADPAERAKAQTLAAAIGRWMTSLPHRDGAVAMSPDNPSGNPNYGKIYSTENNLDYYAVMRALALSPSVSDADRLIFSAQAAGVKDWLKTRAYDPAAGLFKRGGKVNSAGGFDWDPVGSMDVNAWAVSAVGLETLENEFGIRIEDFLKKNEARYLVRDDNTFGGPALEAKGFDFSDAANAAAVKRTGMKWVEGTNQMVLAYRLAGDYFAGRDAAKSAYYRMLADFFSARNPENAVVADGTLSHVYADRSGVQIYSGTGNWKTGPGASAASAGWVYFSRAGLNPFSPR